MVKEALDDVLRKMLHNTQRGVQSIIYNFVEQVVLDLLLKDVIGKSLNAHTLKSFDTDASAEGLRKRLLTSS